MNAPAQAHSILPTDQDVLRQSFELARRHPFYRDWYGDVDDPSDAPATDKHVLAPILREFTPAANERGIYLVRSGGSTQEPLIFPVDLHENQEQRRILAGCLRQAGLFNAATVALNLFGYADLYRTAAILDDLLERCEATTLPMSAHARYEDMEAIARRFRPSHVLGTPSKLGLFAHHLAAAGRRLEIPQLLYAGEPLRASTLDLLRATLNIRRIHSLYGAAETGIIAWNRGDRIPELFELLPGIVVEILSPDAEGFGAIAITNAYRRRFPVFRYRLGDIGRLHDVRGRRMLQLRGRDSRSFRFDEMVYDLDLFMPLADGSDGFQIQLRQRDGGRDHLTLLLVHASAGTAKPGNHDEIHNRLGRLLGHEPDTGAYDLNWVEPGALHADPVTSKTPAIVDLRK